MEKIRLGLIGCGVIGQYHLRAAQQSPLIDLVAVADLIEEKRQRAAQEFAVPKVYPHSDVLLDDPDIDAVILAVPAGDRIQMPLQALARGKHVLIEKPCAMNADMIRQYIAARGDRAVGCCSGRYQFTASAQAAAAFVAGGALGTLRSVYCRNFTPGGKPPTSPPPDWRLKKARNAGGILTNWGCYDLDYLLFVTGWSLQPQTALAQTWPVPSRFEANVAPGSEAETHYTALIRCAGGTVLNVERGEYMALVGESAWQIIGSNGSLRLTMTVGAEKTLYFDEASSTEGVVTRAIWQGEDDPDPVHYGVAHDLAAAALEGRQPRTSLERAMLIQRITDSIYASAENGTAVAV